jgi:phosphatidylglycerophosphatase A
LSKLPGGFLKNPIHFMAFGFGSGCSPKAPGTLGTLAAIIPYLFLQHLSIGWFLGVILLSFVVGCWVCQKASEALGVHDHGGIVWDEFVGFWITMIAAPPGVVSIILGFALFRLFDIWKPQPIKYFDEKVHGGLGIMLDDVIAGIFALASLQLLYFCGPEFFI